MASESSQSSHNIQKTPYDANKPEAVLLPSLLDPQLSQPTSPQHTPSAPPLKPPPTNPECDFPAPTPTQQASEQTPTSSQNQDNKFFINVAANLTKLDKISVKVQFGSHISHEDLQYPENVLEAEKFLECSKKSEKTAKTVEFSIQKKFLHSIVLHPEFSCRVDLNFKDGATKSYTIDVGDHSQDDSQDVGDHSQDDSRANIVVQNDEFYRLNKISLHPAQQSEIKSTIILHFVDNPCTTHEDDADNFLFFLKMFPCDKQINNAQLFAALRRNRVNDDSSHCTAQSEEDASLHSLWEQLEAEQKKTTGLTTGFHGFYAKNCTSSFEAPIRLFAEHFVVPDDDEIKIHFEMPPRAKELWTNGRIMQKVIQLHVNSQAKYENLLKESMHPLQNNVRKKERNERFEKDSKFSQKIGNLNQACQNLTVNCAANNMFEILNRDAVGKENRRENVTEFLSLFNQILLERNDHALMCSQRRNGQATDKFNVIVNRARFLKLQLHDQILSSLLTDAPFSLYYIMCLFEQLHTGNTVNSVQMPVEQYYEFRSKMYATYQAYVDCRATLKECDCTQDGLKILLDAHNVDINIPKSAYLRNMLQTCFLQKLTACRKLRYQVFGEAYTNYAKLLFANTVNPNGIRRVNLSRNWNMAQNSSHMHSNMHRNMHSTMQSYEKSYAQNFQTLLQKITAQMLGKTRLMGFDPNLFDPNFSFSPTENLTHSMTANTMCALINASLDHRIITPQICDILIKCIIGKNNVNVATPNLPIQRLQVLFLHPFDRLFVYACNPQLYCSLDEEIKQSFFHKKLCNLPVQPAMDVREISKLHCELL